LSAEDTLEVQVTASGLVITLLPVPEAATATKSVSSGDQQMLVQLLSAADTLETQALPFTLVITLLPVPVFETATNNVSSGDQQTEVQLLLVAAVFDTQLIESAEYITVPEVLTATKAVSSGLQATEFQESSVGFVLEIQVLTQLAASVTGVLSLLRVFLILVLIEVELVATVLKVTVLLDIARFPEPEVLTAARTFNSAAQQTEAQSLSTAVVSKVQLMPSGLVILLLPVPVFDTAMNSESPVAQITEVQL
jgi:uncharacterized protein (UPF0212 family)